MPGRLAAGRLQHPIDLVDLAPGGQHRGMRALDLGEGRTPAGRQCTRQPGEVPGLQCGDTLLGPRQLGRVLALIVEHLSINAQHCCPIFRDRERLDVTTARFCTDLSAAIEPSLDVARACAAGVKRRLGVGELRRDPGPGVISAIGFSAALRRGVFMTRSVPQPAGSTKRPRGPADCSGSSPLSPLSPIVVT
ncbi:MAG: hypothetical protein ACJ8AH_02640 [Stellaceae bacterium]